MEIRTITKILFYFILSINSLYAQYTAVPDTNFEQALINQGIDSEATLDGQVLTSDINSIEVLNLNHQSINDLSGIEGFTMLEELYCMSNGLEAIDMSSNLLLEVLEISDNTSITSINISQNTALYFFGFMSPGQGYNGLTSIDFSNNTLLTTIVIIGALENIDVSNNLLLESLDCSNNQLTSLDVSNNINLKVLDFADHLIDYGNSNSINYIDLSNNLDLEILVCSGNLNSLDLSYNQYLHTLVAQSTGISSIDLTHNSSLTYLDFSPIYYPPIGGFLTEINIQNDNNGAISHFDTISNPNLSCIYVDDKDAVYLDDWLVDNTTSFVETDAECTTVNIEDYRFNEIITSPNPTSGIVNISTPNNTIKRVIIFNQLGQKVGVYNTNTFSISNLVNGLYIVKTINNADEVFIAKIIKE